MSDHHAPAELPLEFTLADGEQKVLLGGQASLGIAFHTIDGEDLVTLTVYGSESQPTRYPIQSSGRRIEFTLGPRPYFVNVQKIDWHSMEVRLRVDQVIQ